MTTEEIEVMITNINSNLQTILQEIDVIKSYNNLIIPIEGTNSNILDASNKINTLESQLEIISNELEVAKGLIPTWIDDMPEDWKEPNYPFRIKAPCNVTLDSTYIELLGMTAGTFWRTLYAYATSAGFPSYPYMVGNVPHSEVYFLEIAEQYSQVITNILGYTIESLINT